MQDYELINGPHDGAKVSGPENIKQTIYVSQGCIGDDYLQYKEFPNNRFCFCYMLDGFKFKYGGKIK